MEIPHPITGFSPNDIKVIQKSWELLGKHPEETGVIVLVKYFSKYPHNLQYFPKFQNIPTSEMHRNKYFRAHALRIMKALGATVKHINDAHYILEQYRGLAKFHFGQHVTQQAFFEFKQPLLSTLRAHGHLDSRGIKAWDHLIDLVYGVMFRYEEEILQRVHK